MKCHEVISIMSVFIFKSIMVIGIMKEWIFFLQNDYLFQLSTFIHLVAIITSVILLTLTYVSWKKYQAMKKQKSKRRH